MIPFTYTTLQQALQDWPVAQAASYITNIPNYVGLGELRLLRDLNLELFDATDSSFFLGVGGNLITKPSSLVSLRTMQLALQTSTSSAPANPTALGASQITYQAPTSLAFTGTLGPAPVTIPVPAQVTVTDTTTTGTSGGIIVTISGLDSDGNTNAETIYSVNGGTAQGTIPWANVQTMGCSGGSALQTISIGTAAAAQPVLGQAFPVYKRSYDFVTNYGSQPTLTARPKYYAELNSTTWLIAQNADQNYQAVVRFIQRPPSIVTAGTTWLANNCSDLLLLACLMEAENFLKADDRFADLANDYNTKLNTARLELRNSIRTGDYSPAKAAATTVQG
jgi:hypothetical protein